MAIFKIMKQNKTQEILLDMLKYKIGLIFNDDRKTVKTGNVEIYLEQHYEYIKNKIKKNENA